MSGLKSFPAKISFFRKTRIFLLLFLLLLSCGGCTGALDRVIEKAPNFGGVVTEVRQNAILVSVDINEDAYLSCDLIDVSLNTERKNNITFRTGDHVRVYYDGQISESYPGQLTRVYAIVAEIEDTAVQTADEPTPAKTAVPITEASLSNSALLSGSKAGGLSDDCTTKNSCLPDYNTALPSGKNYVCLTDGSSAKDGLSSDGSSAKDGWQFDHTASIVYTMQYSTQRDETDHALFLPTVCLDPVNKTYTFTSSLFSSYLHAGYYKIQAQKESAGDASEKLLKLDDGTYTFYFKIIDDNTLQFLHSMSDAPDFYDGRIDIPVEDGALFVHTGK